MKLHASGDLDGAISLYEQLIDNNVELPSFYYGNYASALRNQKNLEKAKEISTIGLRKFPLDAGLLNNAGNIYKDLKDIPNAISCFRKCIEVGGGERKKSSDAALSLAHIYNEMKMPHLAYRLVEHYIQSNGEMDIRWSLTLMDVYRLLEDLGYSDSTSRLATEITKVLESQLTSANAEQNLRACVSLAHHLAVRGKSDEAISWYSKAERSFHIVQGSVEGISKEFIKQWTQMSWNISLSLLRGGDMKNGWRLYDYGLQVPAEGRQMWQRSLRKPYSVSEVPILTDLNMACSDKSLLIIGEQGVGDTMMFARVAELLIEKIDAQVTLALDKRIVPIYQRSIPKAIIMSVEELVKDSNSYRFDYQIPIGSICRLINPYESRHEIMQKRLIPNSTIRDRMLNSYHNQIRRPLIGISWQGGGRPDRVNTKSIKLSAMMRHLSAKCGHFSWVSLQYGDDAPHLKRLKDKYGIEVIHDDSVEPLRDMDTWLSQVSCCDAVISIANTTVHGAAGQGIPTFVLLSEKSDWRWIRTGKHEPSYWYDSITIGEQSKDGDWGEALDAAVEWLSDFEKPDECSSRPLQST